MTREQKLKFINLIQDFFVDREEDIETYGYVIPHYEMLDIFANAMFNKSATVAIGYDKTVHKNIYNHNLTLEEKKTIDGEYKDLLSKGVLSKTKSGKATRVADKILWYNNILY